MTDETAIRAIRASRAADRASLEDLYARAFPDEDLLPLVRDLLAAEAGVVSLAAVRGGASRGGALAGHAVFTMCGIEGRAEKVCLLGPLGVHPKFRRRGVGAALVREGLARMTADGACLVFVLGDPAYYGRFGFEAERNVRPPYTLADEWRDAWQALRLCGSGADLAGTLCVPAPWAKPALWAA